MQRPGTADDAPRVEQLHPIMTLIGSYRRPFRAKTTGQKFSAGGADARTYTQGRTVRTSCHE